MKDKSKYTISNNSLKMNKKGIAINTLVGFGIALLVFILIAVILMSFSEQIQNLFNLNPLTDVESKVQSCIIGVKGELSTDYCTNFVEIEKDKFISCDYSGIQQGIIDGAGSTLTCDGDYANYAIKKCVEEKKKAGFKGATFNDVVCEALKDGNVTCGVDNLRDYEWISNRNECVIDRTIDVTNKTDFIDHSGQYCCDNSTG